MTSFFKQITAPDCGVQKCGTQFRSGSNLHPPLASKDQSTRRPRFFFSLSAFLVATVIVGCSDQQGASVSARADSATAGEITPSATADTPVSVVQQPNPENTGSTQPVSPSTNAPDASGPDTVTQSEPVAQPTPTQPTPDNSFGSFSIGLAPETTSLTEGDTNGIAISVILERQDRHISPVSLQVTEQRGDQLQGLQVSFDTQTIPGNQNSTGIRIALPIAAGPIQPHSRFISVVASDGRDTVTAGFDLNITPVAAPDVYLLIGQSNMTGGSAYGSREGGAGEPDETHPRIEQLNAERNSEDIFDAEWKFTDESVNVMSRTFTLAEDPIHSPLLPRADQKYGNQIGPGLSFAKAMLPYTTQKIILVPGGWSATSFCRSSNPLLGWNTQPTDGQTFGSTLLLDRAVLRTSVALRESGGIFRGILWHQGESDSNNTACAQAYESNLVKLVNAVRTRTREDRRGGAARGPNAPIPFIAGTMSKGDDGRGEFSYFGETKDLVDAAHRNIGNLVPYAATAVADDLVPPAYPCGANSCVHYGATALREIGYRFHTSLQEVLRANRQ